MEDIFVLKMTNVSNGTVSLIMAYPTFEECSKYADKYNANNDGYKYEVVKVGYLLW